MVPQANYNPSYSVMPKMDVEQTPEGMLLRHRMKRGCEIGILGFFTLIWCAVSLPAMFFAWRTDDVPDFPKALVSLFGVIGLGLLVFTLYRVVSLMAIKPATLLISSLPLRLGQAVPVRFRQSSRLRITNLEAKLICREWVRYRVGTDTHTATHTLSEQPLIQGLLPILGTEIDTQWTVFCSPQFPPSFSAPDNAIEWMVQTTAYAGKLQVTSLFLLPVMPEVVQ